MGGMTPGQEAEIRTYASILDEVRVRILGINTIVSGTSTLPPWVTAELGYTQLRMLCELVALGCLVAHGDIKETKDSRFRKEYKADNIIKQLEKLHPDFYPHPVECTFPNGGIHMERVETGFLTKLDLLVLYHECGEHLHRGHLARIFHPAKPKQPPQIPKVLEWGSKFTKLLSQHHIASSIGKTHLICFLSHSQAHGNAFVVIGQSP